MKYAGKSAKLSVSQTEAWETKVFYIDIPADSTKYIELYTQKAEGVNTTVEMWFDDITVEKLENESGFMNSKGEEIVNASANEAVKAYFSYVPEQGATPVFVKAVYEMKNGVKSLSDIAIEPVTGPTAKLEDVTLGTNTEIKMIVWDGIGTMKQIIAPKKLTAVAQ